MSLCSWRFRLSRPTLWLALVNRRQAHLAAFRYLIAGTVGATFLLIGIGLLYMQTGTLNMADLVERLLVSRVRAR